MIVKRDFGYGPNRENRPLHIYLPKDYERTQERYPVTYFLTVTTFFATATLPTESVGD